VAEQDNLFDCSPVHPGKIILQMMKEKGWNQDELATITGYSRVTINELVTGKNGITKPEMAIALAAAFGNRPMDWLKWDAAYRLSLATQDVLPIQTTARLYEVAPIRDMQKRGWIRETKKVQELESDLKYFFSVSSLDDPIEFQVSWRRAGSLKGVNPSDRAWCFRARKLASALMLPPFDAAKVPLLEASLRELAIFHKEARNVPVTLERFGVRFVVVEPLPGSKIDGAAFWLDEFSPVIAISARIDRIDNFWFTLMHEFAHVKNGDALSVDSELLAENAEKLVEEECELRANQYAAETLIPEGEIKSFARRVAPLYSKARIVQLAHRLKIHPGIIVGRLQHLGEIGYTTHRDFLLKIRELVTETALTDGWGRTIAPVG
jgi:HTH-type transcriptional regulator / antitoxin HigA